MNETIAQLHARRSARAYTGEPVSSADERTILEAACQAPTAGNQQLYSIIVVRDQTEKEELSVTCDNQPFIASAPLVLVFCADVRRWYRAFAAADAETVFRRYAVVGRFSSTPQLSRISQSDIPLRLACRAVSLHRILLSRDCC